MSEFILAVCVTVVIGVLLLIVAKRSRIDYELKYGALTKNEKLRFLFIFIINFFAISCVVYFRPDFGFLYVIGVLAVFFMGVIPIKNGIIKDFLYSSLICSVVVGLVGLVLKAEI